MQIDHIFFETRGEENAVEIKGNADDRMDQVLDNRSGQLLSIGQVTALTGVGKSTLRHWEREFRDFLSSVRTKGNQRRFTHDAIQKIEKIKELVEDQGLTLRGVRKRLEKLDQEEELVEIPKAEPLVDENVQRLADLMSDHIMKRLFEGR